MLALPGVFYTIADISHTKGSTSSFLQYSVINSNIPRNTISGTQSYNSYGHFLENSSSLLVSQILFILFFIASILWTYYAHKDILNKIFKNARIERVLSYWSLLLLGAFYVYATIPAVTFSLVDFIGFSVLSLSFFCAWMFAVHTNDIVDIDIDIVSNQNRPLPKNEISRSGMNDVGLLWLVASLAGAYAVGYFSLFMIIVFTSTYYIYSVPPLRLKRVPILSAFLNSIACLTIVLAGFFFLSPSKMIISFSLSHIVGIIIIFTLCSNFRDIKDIEGDRKAGVHTIPVIFGKYGKKVVGWLLAISFLLVPVFISFYTLYVISLPSAIIAYKLCVCEPYKERYLFILYLVFCVLTVLLVSFLLSFI